MKILKCALFLLPALGCLFWFQWKMQLLQNQKAVIDALQEKALEVAYQKTKNDACLSLLKTADRSYLDKHVEPLVLLEPETRRIQAFLSHQKENHSLARRLEFLKSGKNRIALVEEKRRAAQQLQEVEEKLQHPIELNEEDLKKLLVLIEGVTINPYSPVQGRPQIIFKEFDLVKQMASSEEEIYMIDFKLIKREVQ